uniref:Uncharacterized protein n=1 Tax=Setaria italica TaxID=4555 RepID=K4A4F3_SETIT
MGIYIVTTYYPCIMKMEVNHASFILLAQDISDGLDMVAQD